MNNMNVVKKENFDFLLKDYNFKLCAQYIFILHELADPFIIKSLLVAVQDRINFLSNKIKLVEESSGTESEQYNYYLEILKYMENDLKNHIDVLENNTVAAKIGRQFKKCWDDKNIGIEYLKEKSYFTTYDLIKIEQGDYKLLDSCDIDHLMRISGIRSLDELMQYGN